MAGETRNFTPSQQAEGAINSRPSNIHTTQSRQIAGYEAAIRKVVPEPIFQQASEIVKSHKSTDPRLQDFDVLNMAKVLVVEDDKVWANIHAGNATRAGHEVVSASSAEEARKVLEANGIDFIITDGLEDEWTDVHDLAKEKGIRTIVVSGSSSVHREAEQREVEHIDKGDLDLVTKLTDIYNNI